MGGCVSGCMSGKDKGAQIDNPHAQKTMKIEAFSVEIEGDHDKNESKIRRAPSQADLKYDEWRNQYYGASWGSLPQLLRENCEKYKSKKAVAWRPIEKIVKEDVDQPDGSKKNLEVTYLSDTKTMTYTELWDTCVAFANGLSAIGLKKGGSVGLYEETRAEWLEACYGIWISGMVGVTVYANLGEEALIYCIKEAELPAIVINGKQCDKFASCARRPASSARS